MTPWTTAYQAPPSMGFSRREYWSGVPLSSLTYFLGLLQRLNKAMQAKGLELCPAESQHYGRVSCSYNSVLSPGDCPSLHFPLPPSQLDCPSTRDSCLKPVCPIPHNMPLFGKGGKIRKRRREKGREGLAGMLKTTAVALKGTG